MVDVIKDVLSRHGNNELDTESSIKIIENLIENKSEERLTSEIKKITVEFELTIKDKDAELKKVYEELNIFKSFAGIVNETLILLGVKK